MYHHLHVTQHQPEELYPAVRGKACPLFARVCPEPVLAILLLSHRMRKTQYKRPAAVAHFLQLQGDHPYQHEGLDGLPKWTAADRPLEGQVRKNCTFRLSRHFILKLITSPRQARDKHTVGKALNKESAFFAGKIACCGTPSERSTSHGWRTGL